MASKALLLVAALTVLDLQVAAAAQGLLDLSIH